MALTTKVFRSYKCVSKLLSSQSFFKHSEYETRYTCLLIQTGVLQGSVLAPLLFLLYINNLTKFIKDSRAYHFADDKNILLSKESFELLAKN